MHSTPVTDIKLKGDVLSALLKIFERNPEIRSAFQEVGGFVYVVSVLVSLEGSLGDPPVPLWAECKLSFGVLFFSMYVIKKTFVRHYFGPIKHLNIRHVSSLKR